MKKIAVSIVGIIGLLTLGIIAIGVEMTPEGISIKANEQVVVDGVEYEFTPSSEAKKAGITEATLTQKTIDAMERIEAERQSNE